MKLTNEQTTIIQQLVKNDVKFTETYTEVYDHVLAALESQPEITDIKSAYTNIIEQDFGGRKGLTNVEDSYNKAFGEQVRRSIWNACWQFLKWPLLPGTIVVAMVVFYIASLTQFRDYTIPGLWGLVIGPFGGIIGSRFASKSKQIVKASIKHRVFYRLALYLFGIEWVLMYGSVFLILILHGYKVIDDVSISLPLSLTVGFIVCMIYNIAVLKVYRTQFKMLATV